MATANQKSTSRRAQPNGMHILIIGDWVIDENWYLVRHHSELSKHTGDNHYRRLEEAEPDAAPYKVLELCGAGNIARALETLASKIKGPKRNTKPKITAVGRWHSKDEEYIKHLIHSQGSKKGGCQAGLIGYRVIPPAHCGEPIDDLDLITLDAQAPTMRAVRLFTRTGDTWEITSRVDWEPEPQFEAPDLTQVTNDRLGPINAIVVDDLEKGAVTAELVRHVAKLYPSAEWYIRAKKLDPPWLSEIKPPRLNLFVVGPEVGKQIAPFDSWSINGRITPDTIEVISKIDAHVGLQSFNNIVVLTEDRELVGRFNHHHMGTDGGVYWGRSNVAPTAINQIGWSDALLASLTFAIVNNPDALVSKATLEQAIHGADGCPGVNSGSIVVRPVNNPPADCSWQGHWKTQRELWGLSRTSLGILPGVPDSSPRLEVWRATDTLGDYVCCIEDKKRHLVDIGSRLRRFRSNARERSMAMLIQADPGSGKTHLAKCLAHDFDFEFVETDISQMAHRDDVFDFFDLVATRQLSSKKPLLVYVDEFNALLDGSNVYSLFLTPIESNKYIRNGIAHSLRPCVWIFTGTPIPVNSAEKPTRDSKFDDFMSRMSLKVDIGFAAMYRGGPNLKAAQLEQVYFGALMVHCFFPDVDKIDQSLLEAFHDLNPADAPFRTIRQCVAMMKDVRHGRVSLLNVSPGTIDCDGLRNKGDVRLVFNSEIEEPEPAHP